MLERATLFALCLWFSGCSSPEATESPNAEPATAGSDLSRAQMDGWWKLYQRGDSNWPAARDRWMKTGEEESALLVLSLVRDLVQKAPQRLSDGSPAFRQPQRELLALDESAVVPVLVEAVRVGKEPNALQAIADTLVEFAAIDAVNEALLVPREGDSPHSIPMFLRILVRIGGERALRAVDVQLTTGVEWQIRSHAAEALRLARVSDGSRASAALGRALSDSDAFVVRTALESLAKINDPAVAPAVAETLSRAVKAQDADTAEVAIATLQTLTEKRVPGNDPARWAELADQARERGLTKRP